jgi:hypothetical protein
MGATVDPRARQLIEEEKRAAIMATEEKLAKSLAAINQLRLTEAERIQFISAAEQTAGMERARAMDESIRKANELYDSARKLREELLAAARGAQNIAAGMRDAASASAAISPGAGPRAPGGGPAAGPGSAAWWAEGWRQRGYAEAFGTAAEQRGFLLPQDVDYGKPIPLPSFQSGGFVLPGESWQAFIQRTWKHTKLAPGGFPMDLSAPKIPPIGWQGPIGDEVPIMAHAGEVVLNEREQSVLRSLIGQPTMTDRPAQFIFQFDVGVFARAVIPKIQEAIANGQLIITVR